MQTHKQGMKNQSLRNFIMVQLDKSQEQAAKEKERTHRPDVYTFMLNYVLQFFIWHL